MERRHPDLPTIVMVVFDTARRDRFGCYGYPRPTTPTVDALARQGLLVEDMIANGPWTQPAHGSLFTGLYPTEHGCQWKTGNALRDSVPITLAEWLRDLGYRTVCATNNGLISDKTRLARGFDRYGSRRHIERGRRRVGRRIRKALAGGDSGGRIINRWVEGALRDVDGPLFLFVNYVEPHWAYAPPLAMAREVGGPRFRFPAGLRYRLAVADRVGPWEAIARADRRTLDIYSTLYDGEHRNVDRHLAELLDILRRAGRLDEGGSVVVVLSDHGEHVGEHGLADHHASLDEHLIQVPFVAWGPGVVEPGVREGLYEFVDVLPSVARLLGRTVPVGGLEGRRVDLFEPGPAPGGDQYAFAEWRAWKPQEARRLSRRNPSYDFAPLDHDLVCVRDRRFKLVRRGDGREDLYDLKADESTDVSGDHPDDVRRLRERLDAAVASWRSWEGAPADLTEQEEAEIERQLSDLGYL